MQAAGSIEDLRAIPWIFAWTQTRLHLPVWLGIGGAFKVRALPGAVLCKRQAPRHCDPETLFCEAALTSRLVFGMCRS